MKGKKRSRRKGEGMADKRRKRRKNYRKERRTGM
jgi:hypothetical protein